MIAPSRGTHTDSGTYALPQLPNQDRPEEIHVGAAPETDRTRDFSPPVDVLRSDDRLTVTLEAPGADHDSLSVTVRDGVLVMEGYKPPFGPGGHGGSTSSATDFGHFRERISLPREAQTDDVRAAYEHGILSVTVPLAQSNGSRSISIRQS